VLFAKEHPVLLVGDLSEVDFLRATGRVEAVFPGAAAPRYMGARLHEVHPKRIVGVAERASLLGSGPSDIERDLARRRTREVKQAVGYCAVVGDREIRELESCLRILDVAVGRVVGDGNRPEEAAGRDSWVVVVDLGLEARVNLTRVDV
jgi:hypothetical protein